MTTVFRALLWKEWRQLRALRWSAWGLGAMLPALLLAGAEAASRGVSPMGRLSSYSTPQILIEAVPFTFVVGLWPLLALLLGAQAFSGDRAAGTEGFLLERPVPRSLVWWARLASSTGSLLVVLAGTVLTWCAWVAATGGPAGSGWTGPVRLLALAGPAVAMVALMCAGTAASFLNAPLVAVLMGVILAAVPAAIAVVLSQVFPFARYRNAQIGGVVPWLLLAGYLVASFGAMCRGEPAGRHRVVRGSLTVVLALVIVLFTFAAVTPAADRKSVV